MNDRQIWMIIPTYYPVIGGAQKQVEGIAQKLSRLGQTVRILTRQHFRGHRAGLPVNEMVSDAHIRRIYSRGAGKLGSLLYLLGGWWYLFRHGRKGIYHAHDLGAAAWLAVLARLVLGGRCLIKMRTGRDRYEKSYASGPGRWVLAALLRLADRVLVVNGELEQMVQELGVAAEKAVRLPNTVDTRAYYPVRPNEKEAVRERLLLPLGKTIVLYVGRLHPVKGLDILLRAWAQLPMNVRDRALLVLVGDGPERFALAELAEQLGITESVLLAGAQRAVRQYYWAADVFVLPSRTEGMSGALIEAMACGLPCIASNVGGAPDLIQDGRNGALLASEEPGQLAGKLFGMMGEPERWAEMGKLARKSALEYADMDIVVDRLRTIYGELK
ncbi:MAG: hypothetical protein A2Z21_07755 [Candidatus Fraserbacteria bacterium RBG_16_55_9]|uniref:Glycosyl transferase family 1 domain-containing protein n=1 Tax=Fraserbacteria sp. (strain RBG_16_55_9) TaxID=1817864 RepID=A0A1F5UW29_FRAXR|nr:MAG: hypothetical protein A2Z21_07755 [Candidatus Fraserbacteria bacterium RBG_16_55_9]